ncbi:MULTISPECIES: glycosyltransferase family 4 protein [unclassified Mesorhizobium]|uniref:glycosyltransferase family 4 protein n=1 Tax=unclassified Mesorhizobium TaxID=325217 RepID=UPI0011277FC0|nr:MULTISPECIES: glycosyltransferase family 4 protein [unclassified Mesorhizobium]MCA0032138.1 glycosyltransferase family 4 protein [Mesorhizobium sp. B263B2A]TPN51328.1 glycosyltransferase family 4 protein [Mesorhizobium sp. B1-1-7]TPN56588.1 glycosyltransferase family 4 protein [Mesorhizobium sp. B1-1-9]
MLQSLTYRPRRILMTTDAVGGVWRYSLDLARELATGGDSIMLAGLGPPPSAEQVREAQSFTTLEWLESPPDWMTRDENDLEQFPGELKALATAYGADLVHLNAPTQAAKLDLPCPIVAVSHSCIVTWQHAVRGQAVASDWAWQKDRNRAGFDRAGVVVAPSRSHADMLETCYGPIARLSVVHNGALPGPLASRRESFVLAAARWWDDGKNAAVLDAAAAIAEWPVYAAGPLEGAAGQRACLDHCVSLGSIGHAEARQLMARASIFVSTSIYEPFGLAALEAALSGTPLVLADIATYREIWDGAAIFFDARDPHALAECIARLARDADLRRQLSRRGARRARRYSLQAQSAAMREIYDQAAMAVAGH